jgi:ATP-dependent Clp protease ATP-binding subunit ClpX
MAEKLIESSSEESQEDGESKSRSSQKDNEQAHIISEGTKIEFTPIKIKNALDDYVIGQDHAKKMLSVAVYNHQKRIKYNASKNKDLEISKSNILIIGPTGSGKTLMANTIAKILNLPYASCDATAITETGYVGEDASVIIERLLQNSDGSVIRAQQGIGCIDEIDKIAKKSESLSGARDVSGEGVQQALLKILEGTISHVSSSGNKKSLNAETIPVNTEGILFVCCGAFSGLDKIIAKRLISNSIGFDAKIKNDKENLSNILRNVEAEDLIEFGLRPEFVSRLHTVCVLDELDESLLVKILVEPKNSIIKQYKKLFEIDGFNIQFTDEALFAIAVEAKKRKSGARALRSILDSLLYDLMFEMPSSKENQSIDDSQGEKKEINSSSLKNCDSKDDIDSEEENKEDNKEIIVIDEDFVKKKFAKNKNISSLS